MTASGKASALGVYKDCERRNPRDSYGLSSYSALMADGRAHIIVTIDTKEPIELGDFVSAFTALSNQYTQYIEEYHPAMSAEAKVFVRELRAGSIIADLIPFVQIFGAASIIPVMQQMDVIVDFVQKYGSKLKSYFGDGAGVESATSSDLNDVLGAVVAIANDSDGKSTIEAAYFADDAKQIKAAVSFNTQEANTAVRRIGEHRLRLEGSQHETRERVLMIFTQTNIKTPPLEKRTGERGKIEEISISDKPLIYASDLAEKKIKHEIKEADENVFKKGFVVDVAVLTKSGKIAAYKIINLHQVIDLPD